MSNQVIWTGGIGDVFIIDSHMQQNYKNQIKRMYWATPASKECIQLFSKIYPHIDHQELWTNWTVRPWFGPAHEVWHAINKRPVVPVDDCSISVWHPKIYHGEPFYGSSLLLKSLADISKFKLPKKFVFCHAIPANREKSPERTLTETDWFGIKTDAGQTPIVLVGSDNSPVPNFVDNLIDLRNKTNICEAFEILKHATKFMGIASCFAVMAVKFPNFGKDDIAVKAHKPIFQQANILFTPRKDFSFLKGKL